MDRDSFERFSILGVPICDADSREALALIEAEIQSDRAKPCSIYFANTNTLNLASHDREFTDVMRRADYVFGDGTGVRWGSRILRGRAPRDNVNGTDLVPRIFRELAQPGRRYFLLGATEEGIERAARYATEHFEGWELVGHHHGYVNDYGPAQTSALMEQLRTSRADLLLVGMGNPLQEKWIDRHRDDLSIPVVIAIGGLFAYWSGDLDRAPAWMRRMGIEWLHLMLRQPWKTGRYLLGNPAFVLRVVAERLGLSVYPRVERVSGP